MTLTELFPAIHALPRGEKLPLLQLLAAEIAREEELAVPLAGADHAVCSPYDAHDAASTLLQVLNTSSKTGQRVG